MARTERLTIKTVKSSDGGIDYLLIDTVTGEALLRGQWGLVQDMKNKLSKEQAYAQGEYAAVCQVGPHRQAGTGGA